MATRPAARYWRAFTSFSGVTTAGLESVDLKPWLLRKKTELLKVLDYPDIPLHANDLESDMRTLVTKREIFGGTMSRMAVLHQ
jgi:hypothetical protein